MWISKYKYERMLERIDGLERAVTELKRESRIEVFQPDPCYRLDEPYRRHPEITAKEAVNLILLHLGLDLKHEQARDEHFYLEPWEGKA